MNAMAASEVRPLCASCRILPSTTYVMVGKGKAERRMHLCALCKQLKTAGIARVRLEQRQAISLRLTISNLVSGVFHVEQQEEGMNRQQRRHPLQPKAAPQGVVSPGPIEIKYAHNETQVVMIFSGPVKTLALTEAETEQQIKSLTEVLAHLRSTRKAA